MIDEFFKDLQVARAQNQAIMIEGIPLDEYPNFLELFSGAPNGDFMGWLDLPEGRLESQLKGAEYYVVTNVDLLGDGIDSDKATHAMHILRALTQNRGLRPLMLARPEADLDFRKVDRYRPPYHHPLGHWCQFYTYEQGRLVSHVGPVKHGE